MNIQITDPERDIFITRISLEKIIRLAAIDLFFCPPPQKCLLDRPFSYLHEWPEVTQILAGKMCNHGYLESKRG